MKDKQKLAKAYEAALQSDPNVPMTKVINDFKKNNKGFDTLGINNAIEWLKISADEYQQAIDEGLLYRIGGRQPIFDILFETQIISRIALLKHQQTKITRDLIKSATIKEYKLWEENDWLEKDNKAQQHFQCSSGWIRKFISRWLTTPHYYLFSELTSLPDPSSALHPMKMPKKKAKVDKQQSNKRSKMKKKTNKQRKQKEKTKRKTRNSKKRGSKKDDDGDIVID